ncbi:unnamed protein product, partial [Didymodactylos carnosus]
GSEGNATNELESPNGAYYDSATGKLYVADTGNHRILQFPPGSARDTFGVVVAGNGIAGNGANQLHSPSDVIVDQNGTLYIADRFNNRIQRWLPNATSGDTILGSATGASGTAANLLDNPSTLRFGSNNSLFVVDQNNHRVQLFNLLSC